MDRQDLSRRVQDPGSRVKGLVNLLFSLARNHKQKEQRIMFSVTLPIVPWLLWGS